MKCVNFVLISSYHIPFSVSNEKGVVDLLNDGQESAKTYGAVNVLSSNHAIDLIKRASLKRTTTTRSTASSSSHVICKLSVTMASSSNDTISLTFVDLAGSENIDLDGTISLTMMLKDFLHHGEFVYFLFCFCDQKQ